MAALALLVLIRSVKIKLLKETCYFDFENIQFNNLDEFFELTEESEEKYDYTVSWVDCASSGKNLGRGIFMRANHSKRSTKENHSDDTKLTNYAFNFPSFALSKPTIFAFNQLYYNKQLKKKLAARYTTNHFFIL